MPLMLGSFAGGLWQGAASALSLASAYQKFTLARDQQAALQDLVKRSQENPNDPTNPANATPVAPAQQGGAGDGSYGVNTTNAQPADGASTATPDATSPDMRERNAPATPAIATTDTKQPPGKKQPASKGQDYVDAWKRGFTEAGGTIRGITPQDYATGQTNQLATPPAQPPAQTQPGQGAQVIGPGQTVPTLGARVGQIIAPITSLGSNAVAPPGGPYGSSSQTEPGGAYQYSGSPNLIRPTGQDATPAPSAAPAQAPAPSVVPGPNVPNAQQQTEGTGLPVTGATTNRAAPPMNQAVPGTAGVPGLRGSPSGPAQRGAIPAPTPVFGPSAQAEPAPTGGIGSTIASALKTIGGAIIPSAEAAEAKPAAAPAAAPAAVPAPAPAPTADAGITATKPPTPPPSAPSATAQPGQAAPVTVVPTKTSAVAPGQQGPTVASEVTPVKSPPINTSAWSKISTADQATLSRIAMQEGHGSVTGPELATIWEREGGLQKNIGDHADPHPDDPARGMFQIHYKTQGDLDHGYTLDPHTLEGGATLAARYLHLLATDFGMPPSSPIMHLGYMAGEKGARDEIAAGLPNAAHIDRLVSTFQGQSAAAIRDALLKGGQGNRMPDGARMAAMVKAGNTGDPGVFLKTMVDTGPTGIGMSQHWRNMQAAGERYLILTGNLDGLAKWGEYVAQQSHMGAISNLYEADQALLKGDGATAMGFLARAHAFAPDGASAQFGLDKDGNVWLTNYTDRGNKAGDPIKLTHEMVAQQLVLLQNPANYAQARQSYELKNAQIDEVRAHALHYSTMDESKQAIADANRESREQIAEANRQSREQIAEANRQAREAKVDSGGADERNVRTEVGKEYAPDTYQPQGDEPAQPSPRQAEIDTALRRSQTHGGGGMSGPMARSTAHDVLRDAKDPKKLTLVPNKDGNGYSLVDKDGNVHGLLSTDMGNHIKGLAGTQALPDKPKPQAAIGAGMNSSMVAMQGMNQNLAGIPTAPLQQPQQATV